MALTALQRAAKKEQEERLAKSNTAAPSRNSGSVSGGYQNGSTNSNAYRGSALQRAAAKEQAQNAGNGYTSKDYVTVGSKNERTSAGVQFEIDDLTAKRNELYKSLGSLGSGASFGGSNSYQQALNEMNAINSQINNLKKEQKALEEAETQALIDSGEYRDASFIGDAIVNSFKRGKYNSMYGEETFKAMQGKENEAQKYADILAGEDYKFIPSGFIEEGVSGAAELLGQMWRQMTNEQVRNSTIAGATGAGAAAAIAGQLGPQVMLPEEALTVPAAAIAGGKAAYTAASALSNYRIEAGHAYNEMLENGISEETARTIANFVGGVNASLEALQVDELMKSFNLLKNNPSTKNAAAKILDELLERGIDIAKETAQEVAQEGVTIAGAQAASKMETGEWAYTQDEVLDRLGETAKSSALSFGIMNVPSGVVNTSRALSENRPTESASAQRTQNTEGTSIPEAENAVEGAKTASAQAEAIQQPAKDARASTLETAKATLGEKGYQAFEAAFREGSDPVASYRELTRAYNDGLANQKLGSKALTEAQYDAMFQSGRADAEASIKAQTAEAASAVVHRDAGIDYADTVTSEYVAQAVDQKTAKTVNAVAKALGVKVRFADSVAGGAANAQILDGVVTIEKGNKNPVRFLLSHEITHRMQELAPAEYARLREAIASTGDWADAEVKRQQLKYAEHGRSISSEAALDEAVADYVGQMMENEGELERFIRKYHDDRTLLEKLRDVVRDLVKKLKGTDYDARLRNVEKKLSKALDAAVAQTKAIEKTQKNTTREGGVAKYSSKHDVLALADVDWMDDYSSIKEQLQKHADEINKMTPVAEVNYTQSGVPNLGKLILDEVAKIGGGNMKNGRVGFAFDDEGIRKIVVHAKSDELRAAALASPYVAKYGKLIAGQKNHENTGLTTLTYAAPVVINGETVNVGVAIQFVANGRPRAVNVGYQTGGVFKIDMKKAPKGLGSRISRYGQGTALPTMSASNKEIAHVEEKVKSESGVVYDAGTESVSPGKLSLKTWNESNYVKARDEAAAEMAKALDISEVKAKAYIDSVNSIAKMIADDRVRLDYEASPGRSSFVSNAEYGGSIDFSTVCKKRRLFTGTFEAIQRALPNTALTAEEVLEIRSMMDKKGYEVSCGLCYVEGSRANMGQFTKQFLERYAETNPAYMPNMAEMNTATGQEKLRREHPEVYEAYEYFMNHYGRLKPTDKALFASQQKPKMYQLSTEYQGEILTKFRKKGKSVEEKNKNGGLRIQSFSDFEIIHLIDSMQVIMDMANVGLAGQAYTKVPDFAWALGDTGLKINLSLIAKGVDSKGRLILDEKEGMSEKEAMALRDRYSENVGTIIVVFTDRQLKAAMADERIDYIIPFHRSQWKTEQYEIMGLPANAKDFTNWQNEAYINPVYNQSGKKQRPDNYMPNTYWDFSKTGKENAEAYLQMCAANNRRPKFHYLLVDNKDGSYSLQPDGSTDGYWKTLIDFKMYDNDGNGVPQRPVRPDFNMEQAQRMLNDYTGGHNAFPAAQDIVDEFVGKYKKDHKGAKFSLKDSNYMDAVNKGDMGKAQSMVDHQASIAGFNIKLHHGTAGEPFYVFRQGREGIHFGTLSQATHRAEIADKRFAYRTTQHTVDDIRKNPSKYPDSARKHIVYEAAFTTAADFTQAEMDKAVGIMYGDAPISTKDFLYYLGKAEKEGGKKVWNLTNEVMKKRGGKRIIPAYVKAQHQLVMDTDIGEWTPYNLASVLIDKIEGRMSEVYDQKAGKWGKYNPENIKGIELTEADLPALQKLQESTVFEDMAKFLQSKGVDSIRYLNTYEGTQNEDSYILLSPEQVKSAEPVTYDDNGDAIPLSERFNEQSKDIRYSLKDSSGRTLSEEQAEYFKDSKVRDEDGSLKVMYHGTTQHGFTVFDPAMSDDKTSLFFTDSIGTAESYSGSLVEKSPLKKQFIPEHASNQELLEWLQKNSRDNYRLSKVAEESTRILDKLIKHTNQFAETVAKYPMFLEVNGKKLNPFESTPLGYEALVRLYAQVDKVNSAPSARKLKHEILDWWNKYQKLADLFNNYSIVDWEAYPYHVANQLERLAMVFFEKNADGTVFMGGRGEGSYAISRDRVEYSANRLLDEGGNYPVYLNITHPLYINGNGSNWDEIRVPKSMRDDPVFDGATVARTRDFASYAKANGYDGVIFNDIMDMGTEAWEEEYSTVAVVFDSNQVKDIYNENPTTNPDIRYSLKDVDTSWMDEESRKIVKDTDMRNRYNRGIASMTDERLSKTFRELEYRNSPNTTKGYLTYIDPWDFLQMTTSSVIDFLKRNPNRLNEGVSEDWGTENNIQQSPAMYLRVDEDGKVTGHEGRHRMAALYREGYEHVAVEIRTDKVTDAKPISIMTIRDQFTGGATTYLHRLIPVSEAYREVNKQLFGEIKTFRGETPENMRFSLKDSDSLAREIARIQKEGRAKKRSDADIQADIRAVVEEAYEGMAGEYGTIKPGETPYRDVKVPKKTSKTKNVSKTVRTVMEAMATPDEALPDIKQMIASGDFSYDEYTDEAAISDAESTIKKVGWAQSLADWTASMKKGIVSKQNTAMGWALYNNAVNSGDTDTALTVLDYMVKHQRNAAQALQATRILKKLSPATQLYQVQRSVESLQEELNERYGKKGAPELRIDAELAESYMNAKDQAERDEIMKDIYRDIGRQMPSRFIDKWNAWRYLAMLGNLRTHGRNLAGNAGFAPVVLTKNATATFIEWAVNGVSGGKLNRSKAAVGFGKNDRALLKAAWNDYAFVQEAALSGGKYDDFANANKYIEEGRQVFKFKPLEAARKANSKALDAEDMWFSKPHYAAALASYCKAHGITAEQIAAGKETKNARAYAIKEAQKATYRDTNALSQTISDLGRTRSDEKNPVKKGLGVIVEGILPFRKTPANILARGIEYSPIGLLNGLKQAVVDVRKGKKTGAEAIDSISAGLTGTGLLALGVYLAAQGLVRGHGGGDEDENEFEELMGHQAYALELPDGTSITLDWLAPECLPLFIGVNLWEQTAGDKEQLTLASMLEAVSTVTEPLLEMSCLQSLNDVFDAVGYASSEGLDALPTAIANAATSYLTQGVPTLFGQAERTGEESRMTTYTEKNAFLTGDLQYTLGRVSSRIPGWDYQQIPYIDAWGREEASGSALVRGFNNFLNPSYVSEVNMSSMEKELLRLYEETGEASVLPSRAAKYFTVNNKRKDLTADEYVRYATKQGKTAYNVLTSLTRSKAYKSMSKTEKVAAVSLAYEYANAVAKSSVSAYKPEGWVAKAIEASKTAGIKADQYVTVYIQQKEIVSLKDANGKTIDLSRSLQIMQMIQKTPGITDAQRQQLYEDFDVGKTVRHYSPALVEQKLAAMRKQAK